MIISVASGKGGTGKTLVATNLAWVMDASFLDCDVEEPNAHLFFNPKIGKEYEVLAEVPELIKEACTGCGECVKKCRFNALALVKGNLLVFPELCHSCGVCFRVCEPGALRPAHHILGKVRRGMYKDGRTFADGELRIGQVRSAAVIKELKGGIKDDGPYILDCPPGTSCALIAAVKGSDFCLLVTEPTPFGLNDLRLSVEVLEYLGIPHAVLINRSDLGNDRVEKYCQEKEIPILGRIPFDREIASIYSRGGLLVKEMPQYEKIFSGLAERIISTRWQTSFIETNPSMKISGEIEVLKSKITAGLSEKGLEHEVQERAKQISIISGKGGTGKTTLAASFAALAKEKVIADCDVEAANLYLLLNPEQSETALFQGGFVAEIDKHKCNACAICAQECRFGAIDMTPKAEVDPLECVGCGMCEVVCPLARFPEENPVTIRGRIDGKTYKSQTRYGDFVYARMYPGAEASGKLVTLIRQFAEQTAFTKELKKIFIDGSAGVGCPVYASLTGVDLALVVTEPTLSGLHDLKRAVELARFFRLPVLVVINKADINPQETQAIEQYCWEEKIEVAGCIPFDRSIVDDLVKGVIPVEDERCTSGPLIREIFNKMMENLKGGE